jgi:hypothetical protein
MPSEALNELAALDRRWQYFSVTPEQWTEIVSEVKLADEVPEEVQKQIELCKKLCLHSLFVYEFVTVAMERSFLAIETALKLKRRAMTGRNESLTLGPLLDWAVKEKILNGITQDMKEAIRDLRNRFSHPEKQMIDMPGSALSILQRNVAMINLIYERSSSNDA